MNLYKKTNENDDRWRVALQGHIESWDNEKEDWVPAGEVPQQIADKAMDILADTCGCRRFLRRLWPHKYGCNMFAASQYNRDFELSLTFEADAF